MHTMEQRQALPRWTRRRPSALGVVVAVGTGVGIGGAAQVAPVVAASGFVYLAAAALGRPGAAWPAFGVSFVLIAAGRVVDGRGADGAAPTWLMLGLAAVLAVYGLVRGRGRPAWGLPLQAAAMAVLGAVALAGARVSPTGAGLLVAGALLAHAAWDVRHHRGGRVVARSMAEFCAVLDVVLALLVLAAALAPPSWGT